MSLRNQNNTPATEETEKQEREIGNRPPRKAGRPPQKVFYNSRDDVGDIVDNRGRLTRGRVGEIYGISMDEYLE